MYHMLYTVASFLHVTNSLLYFTAYMQQSVQLSVSRCNNLSTWCLHKLLRKLMNTVKTLNVSVPFISRSKQNRKIKGHEYQLQASILNCMVLIRRNKRGHNNFAFSVANFWGSQIKGFYSKLEKTPPEAMVHMHQTFLTPFPMVMT